MENILGLFNQITYKDIIKSFSLCVKQRHMEYGCALKLLGSGLYFSLQDLFTLMPSTDSLIMETDILDRSLPQFYLQKSIRRLLETITTYTLT